MGSVQIEIWQIHAGTMTLGLILFIFAVIIARFLREKRWWFRAHRSVTTMGFVSTIFGFLTAVYMVAITSGAHFTIVHHFMGLFSTVLAGLTVLNGYGRSRFRGTRERFRQVHITLALLTILTMIIAIYMGLRLIYGF